MYLCLCILQIWAYGVLWRMTGPPAKCDPGGAEAHCGKGRREDRLVGEWSWAAHMICPGRDEAQQPVNYNSYHTNNIESTMRFAEIGPEPLKK